MRDGCSTELRADYYGHPPSRKLVRIVDIPESLKREYGVWDNCSCNQLVSLTNRHMFDDTSCHITPVGLSGLERALSAIDTEIGSLVPCSYEYVIAHRTGARRKKYQQAYDSLRRNALNPKDAIVHMFVKAEKVDADEVETKDPRGIQFRSTRFNLEYARYYHPYEQALYNARGRDGKRVIVKGLNNHQRAQLARDKWECFTDPVALELDMSRFDGHVGVDHLRACHRHVQKSFGNPRHLAYIQHFQINNTGFACRGCRYKSRGSRMSGDQDTGGGNSHLTWAMLDAWMDHLGIAKYSLIVDGDDSLAFIERSDLGKLDGGEFIRENLGMQPKLKVTTVFEDIEFCQSHPVLTHWGWRFVRYPDRAVSKDACTVVNYPLAVYPKLLRAIGDCELSLNLGVPVLQAYAMYLRRASDKKIKLEDDLSFRAKKEYHAKGPIQIGIEARASFEQAFKISVSEQLELEAWFDSRNPVFPKANLGDDVGVYVSGREK